VKYFYNVNIYWPFGKAYDTQFADSVLSFEQQLPYPCFVYKKLLEMSNTDVNASILICRIVKIIGHKLQINLDPL